MMQIEAYQFKNGYTIRNIDNRYPVITTKCVFDVVTQPTHDQAWVFVETLPNHLITVTSTKIINTRWILKEGYNPSELLPKELDESPDEDIENLYEMFYDTIPEQKTYTPVECTIKGVVDRVEWPFKMTPTTIDELHRIVVPLPLRILCPCEIPSYQSYKIIREYIKEHINTKCAVISSDYDFHFKVEKCIQTEPTISKVLRGLGKGSKTVNVTNYLRKVTILELKRPDKDNDYKDAILAPVFKGNTYEECIEQLNGYLSEIHVLITEPLKDCPHCKGTGVLYTMGEWVNRVTDKWLKANKVTIE